MDIQEEAIPKSVLRDREDTLDMLTDQQLIANYRFDWRSILDLADRLQLEHKTCCRFGQLDHRQLLIALRFYATGSFQSVLVDKFHVNRAGWVIVYPVLIDQKVRFPTKQEEDAIAANLFETSNS